MIQGIDVSHFEPPIDWVKAKSVGIEWCYAKASQGISFVDETCGAHTGAARAAGVLTAAYHFFMANLDGAVQAGLFLSAVKGMTFDLPFILDWEQGSVQGQSPQAQINEAMKILDQMETASGKIPWIYMGASLAENLKLPPIFARYPLIIARYDRDMGPVPPPWSSITAWQYTDSASLLGVSEGHTVDSNWFLGSQADLQAFCT